MEGEREDNKVEKRKRYRLSKRDINTKVYTVNQESKHLLVKNIPNYLGLEKELKELFFQFGQLEEFHILWEYEGENEYSDVYWIKFHELEASFKAKRQLNKFLFFGVLLKVEYAPQFETESETREKLVMRKQQIQERIQPNFYSNNNNNLEKSMIARTPKEKGEEKNETAENIQNILLSQKIQQQKIKAQSLNEQTKPNNQTIQKIREKLKKK